jgi:tetratricopeptide (TPR) repeat protein
MVRAVGRTRIRFGLAAALLSCALATSLRADTASEDVAALVKQARYAEAIDAYRKLIATAPEPAVLRMELARTLVLAGRYDEAVDEYAALVQSSPDDFWLRRNLARALTAAGRDPEAIPVLDALIAQYPRDVETLRERALIARKLGDFATARRRFREALAAEQEPTTAAEQAVPEPEPEARPPAPDVTLPLLLGVLVLGIGAGQIRTLGIRTYAALVCATALLVGSVFAWLHLAA